MKPVIIRSRGSFRTEVEAGRHSFVLDEPAEAGGSDEGPSPYDMLAAGLGGCTAMTLVFFARREGIPLEGVDISITHDRSHAKDCADCLSKDGYIHRFHVELVLYGPLSSDQKNKLLAVADRCPVAKTLKSEIRIEESLAGAAT